jgi:hypothetical protein
LNLSAEQNELVRLLNRRLKESSKFWYQCADEYNSIDDFLSSLNALIQSLRNITFILQSNKSLIPSFDEWYSGQKQEMEADKIMKKLNEARVLVVHRTDLELKSYAVLNILNLEKQPILKWQIDPFQPLEDIEVPELNSEFKRLLNEKFRSPVLQLERKWVAEFISEEEILETLAYCYNILKKTVENAYKQASISIADSGLNLIEVDSYLSLSETPGEKRFTYYDLDLKKYKIQHTSIKPTKSDVQEAKDRYTDNAKLLKHSIPTMKGKNPVEDLSFYSEHARLILQKDGYHIPLVLFYYNDKLPSPYALSLAARTDLYMCIQEVSRIIKSGKNISGIIIISEMWSSDYSRFQESGLFPTDDPTHKELLTLSAICKNHGMKTLMHEFHREGNLVVFDQTILPTSSSYFFSLNPIIEAFGLNKV